MSIQTAIAELSSVLGQGLARSKSELDQHATSESYFPPTPPDAVVYPRSTEEVARIVAICAAEGCPLIGWGAGTSLEGQALAARGGVAVDFSRMNALVALSPEDMVARVQPGMTREALNRELRSSGLFFPVDPGANATIGGMASTRASGTTAVRYGTMRDNVLGLEVVLADGRVIRTGSGARKSAAGYDLTGLMVGAEGTLGLITELTLRLHGQPEAITAATCAFATMEAAVDCVIETIQSGIAMARIEFVDSATAAAFNSYSNASLPAQPHLMVEFHGSPATVAEQAESFGAIVAGHGGEDFRWASRTEERSALWDMRHKAHWAILSTRPGARAVVTDICVPISRLAEAVNETRADLEAHGVTGPILGHVGDGNFHAILLFDEADRAEAEAAKAAAHRMVERALRLGGTSTGEHGIGSGKLGYMAQEHGEGWAVMGAIKAALDPKGIMNPGKLVPPRN